MNITYFDPSSSVPSKTSEGGLKPYFKHFCGAMIVANVVLGIVYLMTLNGLATQGFDMESLKGQQLAHKKVAEDMDISLAIPSSIYALESDESVQAMVDTSKKDFMVFQMEKVVMK